MNENNQSTQTAGIPGGQFYLGGKFVKITFSYDSKKKDALDLFAVPKGVSIEDELVQTMDGLYQKHVPANVKTFLEKVLPFLVCVTFCMLEILVRLVVQRNIGVTKRVTEEM